MTENASEPWPLETLILKSTGKKLSYITGNVKRDPDAPIHGIGGMVITKTKCPCCGSDSVESTDDGDEDWGRRCKDCKALWGLDPARGDVPATVVVHTGEAVRQLINMKEAK